MKNEELGPVKKKPKKVKIIAIVVGVIVFIGIISIIRNASFVNQENKILADKVIADKKVADEKATAIQKNLDYQRMVGTSAALSQSERDGVAKITRQQALERIYTVCDPEEKDLVYISNEEIFSDKDFIIQGSNDKNGRDFYFSAYEGGNKMAYAVDAITGEVFKSIDKQNGKNVLVLATINDSANSKTSIAENTSSRSSLTLKTALLGHWVNDGDSQIRYDDLNTKTYRVDNIPAEQDVYFSPDKFTFTTHGIIENEFYNIDFESEKTIGIDSTFYGNTTVLFQFTNDNLSFIETVLDTDLVKGKATTSTIKYKYVDNKQNLN
ncbi:hypothetical protein [Clostridium sp.]